MDRHHQTVTRTARAGAVALLAAGLLPPAAATAVPTADGDLARAVLA